MRRGSGLDAGFDHYDDSFGDHEAVMYMAEWYLEKNMYDGDVQRYLANAHYAQEEFDSIDSRTDPLSLRYPARAGSRGYGGSQSFLFAQKENAR